MVGSGSALVGETSLVGTPDPQSEPLDGIQVGVLLFEVEIVAVGGAVAGVLGSIPLGLSVVVARLTNGVVGEREVRHVVETVGPPLGQRSYVRSIVGVRGLGPSVQRADEGLERGCVQVDLCLTPAEETA